MIFGGAGLVMLYIAARLASGEREQLRTWPLVAAHVDSAQVVTPQSPREDVYAARYWLTYQRNGWPVSTVATRGVYTSNFSSVMHEVVSARARGSIAGIVNPADPKDLQLDPGYNWHFFFDAILLASLGSVFCGFAILFAAMARRQGLDHAAQAFAAGPDWLGAVIGGVMGVLFLGGAVFAVWSDRGQRTHWTAATATVDSADVVQSSSNNSTTYATRYWVSYTLADREYHAPIRVSGSSSNRSHYVRMANDARRQSRMNVLVSSADPYDARTASPGAPWATIIFAVVFGFFGLLSCALGAVFWRVSHRRRTTRRKPSAAPAAGAL